MQPESRPKGAKIEIGSNYFGQQLTVWRVSIQTGVDYKWWRENELENAERKCSVTLLLMSLLFGMANSCDMSVFMGQRLRMERSHNQLLNHAGNRVKFSQAKRARIVRDEVTCETMISSRQSSFPTVGCTNSAMKILYRRRKWHFLRSQKAAYDVQEKCKGRLWLHELTEEICAQYPFSYYLFHSQAQQGNFTVRYTVSRCVLTE